MGVNLRFSRGEGWFTKTKTKDENERRRRKTKTKDEDERRRRKTKTKDEDESRNPLLAKVEDEAPSRRHFSQAHQEQKSAVGGKDALRQSKVRPGEPTSPPCSKRSAPSA
jgi:hypothetical protein